MEIKILKTSFELCMERLHAHECVRYIDLLHLLALGFIRSLDGSVFKAVYDKEYGDEQPEFWLSCSVERCVCVCVCEETGCVEN